jgi:hypothetical protein
MGVIEDRGFQNVLAWSLSPGANIQPSETDTFIDDGVFILEEEVICDAGSVSQTVEMPPYGAAEPLVAEITYRARDVHGVGLGFDRAWKSLLPSESWTTERVCLGEAAYKKEVEIRISASEKTGACNFQPVDEGKIEVDHLRIVTARMDECPRPGEVNNPRGEASLGGWRFGALGQADAGFDSSGSGVRLYSPTGSVADRASMTTTLSVPLPSSVPSPALRLGWKGTFQRFFQIELGTLVGLGSQDRWLGTLVGTGGDETSTFCLPPWVHGNVADLSFQMIGPGPAGENSLVVDSVEVVSDPECGGSTEILDPNFEAAPRPHRAGVRLLGPPEQRAQTLSDAERAYSGGGFLEISYETTGVSVWAETWIFVPAADEEGGPQVTFFSDVPSDPEVQVRWVVGLSAEVEKNLAQGNGWQFNSACLPKLWANRWYRFQVQVGDGGATQPFPTDGMKKILLDDFQVTTSANCN